jgi:hypothetical protein
LDGLLTRRKQATEVSRYYLTFVDCPLACSQRVSRLMSPKVYRGIS